MRRLKFMVALVTGTLLIILGLAFSGEFVQAQDRSSAEYAGTRECGSCHASTVRALRDSRHALALQDVGRDKQAILGDFSRDDDVRMIQFPGEDSARPVTADDIAYTVGAGRYVQRYLYEIERNVYAVLPVEWNVSEGRWQPYQLAEAWPDPAYDWGLNCAGCHTTGLDITTGRWKDDGVQCETCHGPGDDHAKVASRAGRRPNAEELVEIRQSIASGTDAQLCGQCHSRGQAIDGLHAFPTAYLPGQTDLLDAFALVGDDDPSLWWPTGQARGNNMQFNEWLQGGHSQALLTLQESDYQEESCLTCHSADQAYRQRVIAAHEAGDRRGDAPEPLTLAEAQSGITCISCHNPHLKTPADFNLVDEPYTLCVSCHSSASSDNLHHPVREMYEGVTIIPGIEGRPTSHFTQEGGPTCTTCHMARVPVETYTLASHSMRPVMPGATIDVEGLVDSCTTCHEQQVTAELMQRLIDDVQFDTQVRLDAARQAVSDSSADWVKLALDFVEGDGSRGIHNYAYADALLDAVEAELGLNASGSK